MEIPTTSPPPPFIHWRSFTILFILPFIHYSTYGAILPFRFSLDAFIHSTCSFLPVFVLRPRSRYHLHKVSLFCSLGTGISTWHFDLIVVYYNFLLNSFLHFVPTWNFHFIGIFCSVDTTYHFGIVLHFCSHYLFCLPISYKITFYYLDSRYWFRATYVRHHNVIPFIHSFITVYHHSRYRFSYTYRSRYCYLLLFPTPVDFIRG